MKKNTAIWLTIGGVVIVGGVLYLVFKSKTKKEEVVEEDVLPDDKKEPTPKKIELPKLSELIKLPKDTGTLVGSGVVGIAKSFADFTQYTVKVDNANVRSEPNTKSKVLRTVKSGEKILAKEFDNPNWLMIAPGGQFISKNLVKKSTEKAKAFAGIK